MPWPCSLRAAHPHCHRCPVLQPRPPQLGQGPKQWWRAQPLHQRRHQLAEQEAPRRLPTRSKKRSPSHPRHPAAPVAAAHTAHSTVHRTVRRSAGRTARTVRSWGPLPMQPWYPARPAGRSGPPRLAWRRLAWRGEVVQVRVRPPLSIRARGLWTTSQARADTTEPPPRRDCSVRLWSRPPWQLRQRCWWCWAAGAVEAMSMSSVVCAGCSSSMPPSFGHKGAASQPCQLSNKRVCRTVRLGLGSG